MADIPHGWVVIVVGKIQLLSSVNYRYYFLLWHALEWNREGHDWSYWLKYRVEFRCFLILHTLGLVSSLFFSPQPSECLIPRSETWCWASYNICKLLLSSDEKPGFLVANSCVSLIVGQRFVDFSTTLTYIYLQFTYWLYSYNLNTFSFLSIKQWHIMGFSLPILLRRYVSVISFFLMLFGISSISLSAYCTTKHTPAGFLLKR